MWAFGFILSDYKSLNSLKWVQIQFSSVFFLDLSLYFLSLLLSIICKTKRSHGENTGLSVSSSWSHRWDGGFSRETYLDKHTHGLSHTLTDGYRNTLTRGSCAGFTKTQAVWRSEVKRLRLSLSICPQNNLRSLVLDLSHMDVWSSHRCSVTGAAQQFTAQYFCHPFFFL